MLFLHRGNTSSYWLSSKTFFLGHTGISGLSPKIAIHHLSMKNVSCPIKKSQQTFLHELVIQVDPEVKKLIENGFIREVKYLLWISNIVLVKKKSGLISVCVDLEI